MTDKLKEYYQETPAYKNILDYKEWKYKRYKNESDSISKWELMIDSLYEWNILDETQRGLFERFKNYRNESIHFNKNYPFEDKTDIILQEFMSIIRSLFGIIERRDIIKSVP
jgi:hypothetical protein